MTEKGLAEWREMGKVIFQYLKMLRKLPEEEQRRIFDEIQKIENINWATKEDNRSITNCVDAAENMLQFPPIDWLQARIEVFFSVNNFLKTYSNPFFSIPIRVMIFFKIIHPKLLVKL